MLRWISGLMAILMIATLVPVFPAATANSCGVTDDVRACYFTCEYESNVVGVAMSIGEWYDQWASVEGHAYCNGLVAACAGHGHCQMDNGYGPQSGGTCTGYAAAGTLTGGCSANKCDLSLGLAARRDRVDDVFQLVDDLQDTFSNVQAACPHSAAVTSVTFTASASGPRTAELCDAAGCREIPLVCIVGRGIACGIGVDASSLRAEYPRLAAVSLSERLV
jgi:hypothetical protein